MEKADRFALSDDHTTLVVREGKRLRAIAANRKPETDREAARPLDEPSRTSGWIDLERIRLSVEPRREWQQMLREVWRLQRDQFWVPNRASIGRRSIATTNRCSTASGPVPSFRT
jgi:tricorn protease